jgi:hypothetical protein
MIEKLDFSRSSKFDVKWVDELAASSVFRTYDKRWSFSNIYYLTELRDIYLAIKKADIPVGTKNFKKEFTKFCNSIDLPYRKTRWNERRVLEYLNALENYTVLNSDYSINKEIFQSGHIGTDLNEQDLLDLRNIFFSYFRFKELLLWLISAPRESNIKHIQQLKPSKVILNSRPIFFFSEGGRFTDSFFFELESNADLYTITGDDGELARFWDVFVSWGRTLGVLEKFTFKFPPLTTTTEKPIGCCYAISNRRIEVNLLEYVKEKYTTRFVYLPDLILKIALEYRSRIEDTKDFVMGEYLKYRNLFSLERTSEIFISSGKERDGDKILFPQYKDSYVSHLVVRR